MRKILAVIALLMPFSGFCQSKTDDYTIYSNYFRDFNKNRHGKHTFVVNISTDYAKNDDVLGISSVLDDFRAYVKNKTVGGAFFRNFFLTDTLKKGTLWLPLISKLTQNMHKPHVIQSKFSKDLQVYMLLYTEHDKYFGESSDKSNDYGWATFHENYPDHAALVDLSEVVSDGKRAVFYFGWHCGGLCGDGSLVMFYHDGSGWHLVASIIMWYS
jgi:hypothetical protein